MNRLTAVALLALSLAGCKEHQACQQMKTLCDIEADTCKSMRDSARQNLGADGLQTLDTCIIEAHSCAEVTGCTAGAAVKATVEGAKDFVNGLEKALKKP